MTKGFAKGGFKGPFTEVYFASHKGGKGTTIADFVILDADGRIVKDYEARAGKKSASARDDTTRSQGATPGLFTDFTSRTLKHGGLEFDLNAVYKLEDGTGSYLPKRTFGSGQTKRGFSWGRKDGKNEGFQQNLIPEHAIAGRTEIQKHPNGPNKYTNAGRNSKSLPGSNDHTAGCPGMDPYEARDYHTGYNATTRSHRPTHFYVVNEEMGGLIRLRAEFIEHVEAQGIAYNPCMLPKDFGQFKSGIEKEMLVEAALESHNKGNSEYNPVIAAYQRQANSEGAKLKIDGKAGGSTLAALDNSVPSWRGPMTAERLLACESAVFGNSKNSEQIAVVQRAGKLEGQDSRTGPATRFTYNTLAHSINEYGKVVPEANATVQKFEKASKAERLAMMKEAPWYEPTKVASLANTKENLFGTFKNPSLTERIIMDFEGYNKKPYRCSATHWTIGYGNTYIDGVKVTPNTPRVTREEAYENMQNLMRDKKLDVALKNFPDFHKMQPHQQAALFSFVYNVKPDKIHSGIRNAVANAVETGDWDKAAERLNKYINGGEATLERRRGIEADILTGGFKDAAREHLAYKKVDLKPYLKDIDLNAPKLVDSNIMVASAIKVDVYAPLHKDPEYREKFLADLDSGKLAKSDIIKYQEAVNAIKADGKGIKVDGIYGEVGKHTRQLVEYYGGFTPEVKTHGVYFQNNYKERGVLAQQLEYDMQLKSDHKQEMLAQSQAESEKQAMAATGSTAENPFAVPGVEPVIAKVESADDVIAGAMAEFLADNPDLVEKPIVTAPSPEVPAVEPVVAKNDIAPTQSKPVAPDMSNALAEYHKDITAPAKPNLEVEMPVQASIASLMDTDDKFDGIESDWTEPKKDLPQAIAKNEAPEPEKAPAREERNFFSKEQMAGLAKHFPDKENFTKQEVLDMLAQHKDSKLIIHRGDSRKSPEIRPELALAQAVAVKYEMMREIPVGHYGHNTGKVFHEALKDAQEKADLVYKDKIYGEESAGMFAAVVTHEGFNDKAIAQMKGEKPKYLADKFKDSEQEKLAKSDDIAEGEKTVAKNEQAPDAALDPTALALNTANLPKDQGAHLS